MRTRTRSILLKTVAYVPNTVPSMKEVHNKYMLFE